MIMTMFGLAILNLALSVLNWFCGNRFFSGLSCGVGLSCLVAASAVLVE